MCATGEPGSSRFDVLVIIIFAEVSTSCTYIKYVVRMCSFLVKKRVRGDPGDLSFFCQLARDLDHPHVLDVRYSVPGTHYVFTSCRIHMKLIVYAYRVPTSIFL